MRGGVDWEASRPRMRGSARRLVDNSHLGNANAWVNFGPGSEIAWPLLFGRLHRHGGVPTYDQDVFATGGRASRYCGNGSGFLRS